MRKSSKVTLIESPTFKFDPVAKASYVSLRKGKVNTTKEVAPGVLIDFDSKGQVVGVEILS